MKGVGCEKTRMDRPYIQVYRSGTDKTTEGIRETDLVIVHESL